MSPARMAVTEKSPKKKVLFVISLISLLFNITPVISSAREQYATETGKDCTACHIEAMGGKRLTAEGQAYLKLLSATSGYRAPSLPRRLLNLAVGYAHIVFAFLWFGTIMYVHIVLKPAYAVRGLPKGELTIGWLSIVLMAITGSYLAWHRLPTASALVSTKFGILLCVKILIYLFMVFTASMATFVIGPRLQRKNNGTVTTDRNDLTANELATFDGHEGGPAYVGFQDRIYDVSASKLWKQGVHVGRHRAGMDLTDVLSQAPHGAEKITARPAVGTILPSDRKPSRTERRFYFFAYLSLFNVLVILLILSLWKWW